MPGGYGRDGSTAHFVHTPPQRSQPSHIFHGTWAQLDTFCSLIASRRTSWLYRKLVWKTACRASSRSAPNTSSRDMAARKDNYASLPATSSCRAVSASTSPAGEFPVLIAAADRQPCGFHLKFAVVPRLKI